MASDLQPPLTMNYFVDNKSEIEFITSQVHLSENEYVPFCYSCYKIALTGVCTFCGSDDLMRLFHDGCDYEVNQIFTKRVIRDALPIDVSRAFEEFVKNSYSPEFRIGWMTLETVECMKTMDPFSWAVEMDQWIAQNIEEGVFITFDRGKTYYYQSDFESIDQFIYRGRRSAFRKNQINNL